MHELPHRLDLKKQSAVCFLLFNQITFQIAVSRVFQRKNRTIFFRIHFLETLFAVWNDPAETFDHLRRLLTFSGAKSFHFPHVGSVCRLKEMHCEELQEKECLSLMASQPTPP